ncbi:unnamed protein product [Prunus armeniaca]
MSWLDWEDSFAAFKAFFNGDIKVLRSIAELLPFCHRYEAFMESRCSLPAFSRSAAFRVLNLVLYGMDTMHLLDITYYKFLCWRDVICEAMPWRFRADFLLNMLKDLACAVFGARAIHRMKSLIGFDGIKVAVDTLSLKQRELEDHCHELHAFLLAKRAAASGAECVVKASARSSHDASSVLLSY